MRLAHCLLLLMLVFWSRLGACGAVASNKIPSLAVLSGDWQNAAEVRSLPALNGTLGSAQVVRDVLAVGKLSFPPLTLTEDTGGLLIDGEAPALEQTRWFAFEVLRKGGAAKLGVETATRMTYEQGGLLFHVAVTNAGDTARSFELRINLSAATSRYERWGWGVPRDKEAPARFSAVVLDQGQSLVLRDLTNRLANCFSFERKPDELLVLTNHGQAVWHLTLKPQASFTLNYGLAFGEQGEAVHALASQWAAHFDRTFEQVQSDWQQRFEAMFTPGNAYFSGNLPVLVTSDEAMRRVYYISALSLLSVYRTGFPVQKRVYVSNTPESNCTMMYFWDTREWATAFALLDPAMLKECLRAWLARGLANGYAEEYLTGTLQGPWYSANDYSVFILLDDYLNVTGDRAFLSEKINGLTVLAHLDAIATHWKTLVRLGRTLADYGKPGNLLECVPTYIHEVPSFNAANVWMMRRVAELHAAEGNAARAAELRADAARLLPAVLALYEPKQGVWDSLHRDGTRVEMRHVFDFTTIGLTISRDLSPEMRTEMSGFVERELLTDHWMRAQSLSDPAAAQSDRPDHGPMGAFCAWPAETLATFCEFGQFGEALDFLHRCAAVTREGPFGQSRELLGKTSGAPVRIAERGAKGRPTQTYNASNGGGFAEAVLRGFFGYQPDVLGETLVPDPRPRGFQGQLLGLGHHGRRVDLASTEQGLRVTTAAPSAGDSAAAAQPKSRAELLATAHLPEPTPPPVPGATIALPEDWARTNLPVVVRLSQAPEGELSLRRVSRNDGKLYLELSASKGGMSCPAEIEWNGRSLGREQAAGAVWLSLKPRIGSLELRVFSPGAKEPIQLSSPTTLVEVRGRHLFLNGEPFLMKGAMARGLDQADATFIHSLGLNTLRGLDALTDCECYGFMNLASLNFGGAASKEIIRGADKEFEQAAAAGLDWLQQNAPRRVASPYTLILQLGNEFTGAGNLPPGLEPLSRARAHAARLVSLARNYTKSVAPMLPVGYANQDLGFPAPDCLDVYMHNSFLDKDRYGYPWNDFLRWQGCLPPDGPQGEGRPFVNSEFGANRYLCQAYLRGPNNPFLERIHAWNFSCRWAEFMEHDTVGGCIYCLYDLDQPRDQGCSCFGMLTYERLPKLACWEIGHLWRDFEVVPQGREVVVSFKRDYWARDCRLTLAPLAGPAITRKLEDFAPHASQTVAVGTLPQDAAAKGFRWTLEFTTHSGLTNQAAGAWPATVEEQDFLQRLQKRDTYPFLKELFDTQVLTAQGKPAPPTLAEMTNSDGLTVVVLRKRNGVAYVLALARENPNTKGPLRSGVILEVACPGKVVKVDDTTGQPLAEAVETEAIAGGLRLKNVQAARIPGAIGQRSQTPFQLPIYRISP